VIPYLRAQQAIYERTGGRVGRRLAGAPTLLLRTTGRKTGLERTNALTYLRDGGTWVVFGSNGGSDRPPSWLVNLEANREVSVQDGTKRRPATARIASSEERDRLWPLVNRNNRGLARLCHPGVEGRYDVYQRRTSRRIPLVILEATGPG
jgi:deazaflavin-dependent oxidoreductase (nitroreductase family)